MPGGGKEERLILPGKVIREAQKGIQVLDGASLGKTLCWLCRKTEKPKVQSCIQNQAQMALPLPVPQYWRTKIATFALQYYGFTDPFPSLDCTPLHKNTGQSMDTQMVTIFPLQFLGYVQFHLFHKHLSNQSGHMSLSKGICIISAEILT